MEDIDIALMMMEREEEGLRLLLKQHTGKINGYLRNHFGNILSETEIDEVLYRAAFNVWRSIDTYDFAKGSLGAWFLRIARNCAIDLIRREKRFTKIHELVDKYEDVPMSIELESTHCKKLRKAFRTAVESLPPLQRSIIEADLAAGDQSASASRLAEMHGSTAISVRVSRNKAREKLRQSLDPVIEEIRRKKDDDRN